MLAKVYEKNFTEINISGNNVESKSKRILSCEKAIEEIG